MKQSKLLIPTMREIPNDAEAKNLQLLLRAGFIRQVSGGVYAYLPLATRVLKKMYAIIGEEFEKIGSVEIKMPTLLPSSLLENTSEVSYDDKAYNLKNRTGKEFVLGSAYEGLISELIGDEISSYKRLPLTLFQIATKYRNDKRSRFGLLRSHEFILSDAYSFHATEESLNEMYRAYQNAFEHIFERLGVKVKGLLGDSQIDEQTDAFEYMALSESGDKIGAFSTGSNYASDLQAATSAFISKKSHEPNKEIEEVTFEKKENLEEAAQALSIPLQKTIKAQLYLADDKPALVLVRADQKINELKIKKHLEVAQLIVADETQSQAYFQTSLSYLGPVDAPDECKIYADLQVQDLANALAGANKENTYLKNVNPDKDFPVDQYADLRLVQEGDTSPDNLGTLELKKGVEIGRMIKVGTYFSERLKTAVLDENGQHVPVQMGYYELGISRLLATIVEQNSDEEGINWPTEIAPFDLHIVQTNMEDEDQTALTNSVEEMMLAAGYQVLVDDRQERSGVKFADADLIGCPVRITVGNKANEGAVSIKFKQTQAKIEVKKEELVSTLAILLNSEG
ncbi:proline--tRNA ligase [Tetragenococcus halophilus]|uniref:proline--tRNA ligase n=1 Tax=Tetragenococcus halophilus TaxID=51669 RepID=UPI000CC41B87|nr:proline--tRNA ligase [Tetragenococcus halophilus]MCO7026104.1 proline--tRNA ligase [Tetragenococcus halophilus]MCO8284115.1 proline--tRNA ligase [Tetragenococcus halophilus]GBD65174.1 prolyl-tRNA synthetase [Tetragenococcus halophilus subsp. halophilus]GBD77304.1 prolyl-tRNA synthetase [Tetragenococcus halophilus subsp. halophilus]